MPPTAHIHSRQWRLALIWMLLYTTPAFSQNQTFTWYFAGSTTLPECGTIGIIVDTSPLPNSTQVARPPYYMLAYEVSGIATVSNIGSDSDELSWTIKHASGTQLLLQVADSLGNTGGVGPAVYNVTVGGATNCHPSTETTPITLAIEPPNLTVLQSCGPLVLDINGGTAPYTVSLVATNSPTVKNATLLDTENRYTWINQSPGTNLIATVSDASVRVYTFVRCLR
ncbi:hypothetical protein SISSUDRAFT_666637 [Sistotremastrum suecicum HHB10207 ss-3]|uniref:Ig-like domain-containing protein n=1 Tax=Sistotremastrum suecicum HHB10207 ss-3 TaxID=1314776 RepID=A0A166E3Y7_9AGAM|nr:hypothetical protein SISSUDRAFT_666637 [Sistotremastrum suecicum HHB10207 ss-3]